MSREPHEVTLDDVQIVEIACGRCGGTVRGDGDYFWHVDPELNPADEPDTEVAWDRVDADTPR